MIKEWYIAVEQSVEGPFSTLDLKHNKKITPDTFVWKEGFSSWKRIRDVPELRPLFFEEEPVDISEDPKKLKKKLKEPEDEIVLEWKSEPPYLFWILVAVLLLLYLVTQLYWD